jgi:hypothetical protein
VDQLLLLRAVREVSLQADPEAPARVSQRTFDATCQSSPSLPEVPPARSIARRLRLPWPDVLTIAHEPPRSHAHRLGRALTRPEQDWLGEEHIAYVLQLAARKLGADSVSPGEYRRERERMLAEDRRRARRLRLPTDDQIRLAVGGEWYRGLELAELAPRQPHTGCGISTVELLDRCYEAHHAQPSAEELRRFARANRIPFQPDRKRTWNECVAAWKDGRRARGLDSPTGLPPRSQRPNYSRNVGAARAGERRRRDWSHLEDCVEVVILYLEELSPRERAHKRGYQDWAAARDDAPSYSAFDAHGGWGRVRELALERF